MINEIKKELQESTQPSHYPPWILDYLIAKTKYFQNLSFDSNNN
jgi:hypothetical protein